MTAISAPKDEMAPGLSRCLVVARRFSIQTLEDAVGAKLPKAARLNRTL